MSSMKGRYDHPLTSFAEEQNLLRESQARRDELEKRHEFHRQRIEQLHELGMIDKEEMDSQLAELNATVSTSASAAAPSPSPSPAVVTAPRKSLSWDESSIIKQKLEEKIEESRDGVKSERVAVRALPPPRSTQSHSDDDEEELYGVVGGGVAGVGEAETEASESSSIFYDDRIGMEYDTRVVEHSQATPFTTALQLGEREGEGG
eukprot:CAMPEP_0113891398 /NCGR_PEP_ID=MMETSP0780_2-20120614/14734_1 /TAXON_ID=652834 /ORGANISM="Palpitomonas bilix" /LENGTH=204 /DNA_ID=CAMNT_0000881011 /DNA_START=128 /DNA_END=738 /DNA_ORIENTATION=+ /assembly_acc=CAM_ASM_000599